MSSLTEDGDEQLDAVDGRLIAEHAARRLEALGVDEPMLDLDVHVNAQGLADVAHAQRAGRGAAA